MSPILSPCCLCLIFADDRGTPPPAAVLVPHIGPTCRPCQQLVHNGEDALSETYAIAARVILPEDRNNRKGAQP